MAFFTEQQSGGRAGGGEGLPLSPASPAWVSGFAQRRFCSRRRRRPLVPARTWWQAVAVSAKALPAVGKTNSPSS